MCFMLLQFLMSYATLRAEVTHFGNVFTFVSSIWIHLRSLTIRFCSFMDPGTAKSKSVVNWTFIIWNTGSCTVARARLARLSDAALLNCALTELEIFSDTYK